MQTRDGKRVVGNRAQSLRRYRRREKLCLQQPDRALVINGVCDFLDRPRIPENHATYSRSGALGRRMYVCADSRQEGP